MNEREYVPGEDGVEEVPLDDALIRLDRGLRSRGEAEDLISLEAVQVYVQAERRRVRRLLFGISSVFLAVTLFIFIVFLAIGIFVLRNTRAAQAQVGALGASVHQRMDTYADTVQLVSDRVYRVQSESGRIADDLAHLDRTRKDEKQTLQGDLENFSGWVAAQDGKLLQRLRAAEARHAELEAALAELRRVGPPPVAADAVSARGVAAPQPVHASPPAHAAPAATAPAATSAPVAAVSSNAPVATGEGATASELRLTQLELPNGDRYAGQVADGTLHGTGDYVYAAGPRQRYRGGYREGRRHGRGELVFATGARYVGDFVDDRMEGQGTFYYINGDTYAGRFRAGLKHGTGTYHYANGNIYEGAFEEGEIHGQGTLRFANGDRYTGDFVQGVREGEGLYEYANGGSYRGAFRDGRRHGQGRYAYASGGTYDGTFVAGQKHGDGVYRYADGTELAGLWENDAFVAPR